MRSAPDRRDVGERGIALVVVLWTLLVLSLLTVGFAATSRTEARATANGVDQIRVRALLRAGLERTAFALLDDDPERRWRADGTPYAFALPEGQVEIRVLDEAGRIDLNRAEADLIARLLIAIGASPDDAIRLADAVLDWRDADDDVQPNGAERVDYEAEDLPPPGNRPFRSTTQLRDVLGFDRAVAEALLPHVTVFSPAATVSPLSAAPLVLAALPGVTPGDIDAVVARRAEPIPPTPDILAAFLPTAAEALRLETGPIYTVTVAAVSARGSRGALRAVIWVAADPAAPYRVLDWREEGLAARPPDEEP
jgi:general secretion pathway protein K